MENRYFLNQKKHGIFLIVSLEWTISVYQARHTQILYPHLSFVYFGYWAFCGIAWRGPVRLSVVSIASALAPAFVRWPQSVLPHVRCCTEHYRLARRI